LQAAKRIEAIHFYFFSLHGLLRGAGAALRADPLGNDGVATKVRDTFQRHHPRKQLIKYSRAGWDWIEQPQRKASLAFAGNDDFGCAAARCSDF
jgi:hypothetical protein